MYIMVALTRSGAAVTKVFAFILPWNEFLFALILTSQAVTIPVSLPGLYTNEGILWGPMAARKTVVITRMFILTLSVRKRFIKSMTRGAIRLTRSEDRYVGL